MKKQVQAADARPSEPGVLPRPGAKATPSGVGAPENPKHQKTYLSRLEELGLPPQPIVTQPKPIRQFQLAHLAATLGRASDDKASPSELTAKALALWNAAGRTLHLEDQAGALVCGLFHYNRADWEAHGKALIASLDDLEGAAPGHNPADIVRRSYEKAQKNAGLAVSEVWKRGPVNADALKCLFSGKAETEESRAERLGQLLQYAKATVDTSDAVKWDAHDGNFLKASIERAWLPLGIWQPVMKMV